LKERDKERRGRRRSKKRGSKGIRVEGETLNLYIEILKLVELSVKGNRKEERGRT